MCSSMFLYTITEKSSKLIIHTNMLGKHSLSNHQQFKFFFVMKNLMAQRNEPFL